MVGQSEKKFAALCHAEGTIVTYSTGQILATIETVLCGKIVFFTCSAFSLF